MGYFSGRAVKGIRMIWSDIDIVFIRCRGISNSKPVPRFHSGQKGHKSNWEWFLARRFILELHPLSLSLSFLPALRPSILDTVGLRGPAAANNRLESLGLWLSQGYVNMPPFLLWATSWLLARA